MKLKTTIYGKSSTLIGTPDEISALLDAVRRTAKQRAIDSLPRIVIAGERLASEPAPKEPVHVKNVFKPTFEPVAQTREEIVKEAIADVAELLKGEYYDDDCAVFRHVGALVDFVIHNHDRVEFLVNNKKGVVVAKLLIMESSTFNTKTVKPGEVATTGIARCAPSDVFNEHVGKAIALRRALGLEVPTKYYEVGGIAPEGKQVGDVVLGKSHDNGLAQVRVVAELWDKTNKTCTPKRHFAKNAKVIDDSARYVAPSTPAAKVVYVGE